MIYGNLGWIKEQGDVAPALNGSIQHYFWKSYDNCTGIYLFYQTCRTKKELEIRHYAFSLSYFGCYDSYPKN